MKYSVTYCNIIPTWAPQNWWIRYQTGVSRLCSIWGAGITGYELLTYWGSQPRMRRIYCLSMFEIVWVYGTTIEPKASWNTKAEQAQAFGMIWKVTWAPTKMGTWKMNFRIIFVVFDFPRNCPSLSKVACRTYSLIFLKMTYSNMYEWHSVPAEDSKSWSFAPRTFMKLWAHFSPDYT